jgi:HEAT repeat protein
MRAMVVVGTILVAAIAVILALVLDLDPPLSTGTRTGVDAALPASSGPRIDVKAPPPKLPSLNGRPGKAWVADLLGEPDLSAATVEKLAEAGVDAVPLLAALILHPDPRVRWGATDVLQRLSELGGYTSVKTLLILTERAGDPDVRERSVVALGKMGALGRDLIVPVLVTISKDRHDAVRIAVAEALGLLGGREASEALRVIRREDTEVLVRLTATDSLLALVMASLESGEGISDRCRIAIEVFEAPEAPRHLGEAASILGHLGIEAAEAVPLLAASLKKQNNDAVIWALAQLGPGGIRALTDLVRGDLDLPSKQRIIQALGAAGRKAESAVPALIPLLKDPYLDSVVANALARIGGAETATRLLALLDQEAWQDELYYITTTLAALGDEKCVAVFLEDLRENDNLSRRSMIANALGEMGEKARSAVPALIGLLKETGEGAPGSYNFISALSKIGGTEAADVIRARLGAATEEWHRMALISALGEMGADAEPAVMEIAGLLDGNDDRFRWVAIRSLRRLGPVARAAVPSLERLLDSPEAYIRRAAAIALKAIKAN